MLNPRTVSRLLSWSHGGCQVNGPKVAKFLRRLDVFNKALRTSCTRRPGNNALLNNSLWRLYHDYLQQRAVRKEMDVTAQRSQESSRFHG